ncbi:tyrosine-type recombinase/integrase [Flavobacterium sp. 140616W15]|uniref:tyrosine-type recombinase/integrase n=1 Tax=Flavobacterium sp. 140616W15 TaxID=2478552 RepID=UPI000F0C669C|nr:tyrosine-type recombinase/integrase [Flavobacterium sp. 140616W15]AYN05480.1 integrase [Flavobacterium sp. 140616W15]
MATGKFRLKTNNDWNTIFFRFKQGNKFDIETSIGIQVPKGRWSDVKQEILSTKEINYKTINVKLKEFEAYIRKEYENTKIINESTIINSKWLKEKIDTFFNRETENKTANEKLFFSNFIGSFIEEAKTKRTKRGTPVKPRTIQYYNTTLNKITTFESFAGYRLKLTDIDLNFHEKFIDYLEKEEFLINNTIGGFIDTIKLFCGNADKKELNVCKDYKLTEFYSPSNKTKDIYLKDSEIDLIYNTKFEQDYLDNTKDWFIIGVRTGFRISDFLKLEKENLDNGFIYKNTHKTEFPVIIPIHEQVQEILDKRNGEFPRKISDQKFNEYIKKVSEIAGLTELTEGAKKVTFEVIKDGKKKNISRKKFGKYPKHELVTSHACRRSFATNLYGKIDTLTIMKITGHKSEKIFLDYIKITPKEYAEKLKAFWKNNSL